MSRPSPKRFRSVVIAGAGTGLGREVALKFASEGSVVFGTAESAAQVQDLKVASGGRVSLAACDITNMQGLRAWAEGVSEALDGAGLDVLVILQEDQETGPLEAMPLEAIRRELELNIVGAIAVINAFLPSLRVARGRVIQVSSWIARLAVPFSGLSAASTAALEALSAAYRAEVQPSGVDVVMVTTDLIVPGDTDRSTRPVRPISDLTPAQRDLYGKRLATATTRLEELAIGGTHVAEVAAQVVQIAQAPAAASHVPVGDRAIEIAAAAQSKNDAELDAFRLSKVGLGSPASPKQQESIPLSTVDDNPAERRFELPIDGSHEIAAVYYRLQGERLTLTHTIVPERFSGQGIGSKLARGVFELLRASGRKAVLRCPFMAAYYARHPEYADVVDTSAE